MYKYQVNYEKVFTSGILKGRRYHDWLRFTDWQSADAFVKRDGEIFKCCSGAGDYRMESPILTALEPEKHQNSRIPNAFPNHPALIGL